MLDFTGFILGLIIGVLASSGAMLMFDGCTSDVRSSIANKYYQQAAKTDCARYDPDTGVFEWFEEKWYA